MNISPILTDPIAQKATTIVATGAASSPWWLPVLKEFSQIAAELLPIFGVTWLLVQIFHFIVKWDKKKK